MHSITTLLVILLITSGCSTSPKTSETGRLLSTAPTQPVTLFADGVSDPYSQVKKALAAEPETPDCAHKTFGPHITQEMDSFLRAPVFNFHLHVKPDDDRCLRSDRQRVEIKTMGNVSTPDYLKGFQGDSVVFRWRFMLPPGFQPSRSFTHLHQITAFDSDNNLPLLTLTARKGKPDILQIIHIDSNEQTHILSGTTPLQPVLGIWLEAYEQLNYGPNGRYSLVIKKVKDDAEVLSFAVTDLELWRKGATVIRPKWGIYRSLKHPEQLRDEEVRFGGFCIAKGEDDCGPDILDR